MHSRAGCDALEHRRGGVKPRSIVLAPRPRPSSSEALQTAMARLLLGLESKASRVAYEGDWRRFMTHLDGSNLHPAEVKAGDVASYMEGLRTADRARSSRARTLSVLRRVYAAFVEAGICTNNPAREIKTPAEDREPRTPWLAEDELAQLLTVPAMTWRQRRDRLIVLTLVFMGWRRAEVASLHVGNFGGTWPDAVTATTIVKRGKKRTLGVPPTLAREIAAWLHSGAATVREGPVFPYAEGADRSVTPKMVYDAVKRVARRCGVDKATPHGLRRTFVTLLDGRGVPLEELQLAVSHESITTTEQYRKARRAATQAPGERLADLIKK